jgi:RHS repeat-associated protein
VSENYAFDPVGNRTSSHRSSSYTYQPFNKLAATQTASYQYDANGNTQTKSDSTGFLIYGWDNENRMVSARKQNKIVRYQYDALGRRVSRIGKTLGSTKYAYDGDDVILDDGSEGVVKYQNGPGIDNKLRAQSATTVNYFLADHLGSTNGLTNSTGALTSQTAYDSFGNQTGSLATRYGFTGRERDDFTGLMYYRARFYDPNLGRFISEDPIGFEGGDSNFYAYVGNNPTGKRDPLGLYEEDVHYYLTYYLAKRNGCFSDTQARIIAFGNQSTDDVPATFPGYGSAGNNSTYHALNTDARPGLGSSDLYRLATQPSPNDYYYGRYLHYYQDTYSHAGYTNSTYGHAKGLHGVDKTATNVALTLAMAKGTADELSRYSQSKCGCGGPEWDAVTDATVAQFAAVPTNFPNIADINGVIAGDYQSFIFASPHALDRKARILGLQR